MDKKEALERWQRGEIDGHEARRLTGCASIGFLIRMARDLDVEILFYPQDIINGFHAG